jgi:hypothetical protein
MWQRGLYLIGTLFIWGYLIKFHHIHCGQYLRICCPGIDYDNEIWYLRKFWFRAIKGIVPTWSRLWQRRKREVEYSMSMQSCPVEWLREFRELPTGTSVGRLSPRIMWKSKLNCTMFVLWRSSKDKVRARCDKKGIAWHGYYLLWHSGCRLKCPRE